MALLPVPLALDPQTFPNLDRYTGAALPKCSRPITYGVKVSTLAVEFDSGHSQRRMKAPPKATFDLKYNALLLTEYQTLRDFFLLVLNTQAFHWTDPVEKVTYKVLFNQDVFAGVNRGHGPRGPWYELELQLIQSWD